MAEPELSVDPGDRLFGEFPPAVYIGKVGCESLLELEDVQYHVRPEGYVGVSLDEIDRIRQDMGQDGILWLRTDVVESFRQAPELEDPVILDRFAIDPDKREVQIDGMPIDFTPKEYDIFTMLFTNHGRPLGRQQIYDHCWGKRQFAASSRTLDAHMTRVRQKLGSLSGTIHSKRGIGFMFDTRSDTEEGSDSIGEGV